MFDGLVDTVRVLSLPSSADRRARLPGHLAEFGIGRFTWHDAFGPDAPEVQALFDEGRVQRYPPCFRCGALACGDETCNNVLIPAQVANFASFRAIWEAVAAEPQVALILEDDVSFHPWAARGLKVLRKRIATGGVALRPDVPLMLRLGWPHDRDHRRGFLVRLRDRVRMSNPCHIMTSAFAAAMLERFDGVRTTSDIWLHRIAPRPGEALTLFPPIATELSFALGAVDSSIHPKTAYLDHLEAEGREEERRAHEARLRRHVKHVFHRPLLVTGAPGAGLAAAATRLSALGHEVGTDRLGPAGLAAWHFAVEDEDDPFGPADGPRIRHAFHWDRLVHVVRDPARAIPDIAATLRAAPEAAGFCRAHILRRTGTDIARLETDLDRAAAVLCLWAGLVAEEAPDLTLRLEDEAETWRTALDGAGIATGDSDGRDRPGTAPSRALPPLSDPARRMVEAYCAHHGYPVRDAT